MSADPRRVASPSGTGGTASEPYYVEIVAYVGETVIERRGPFSEWKANKVDDGLNINLNHAAYFTRVVENNHAR